MANSRSSVPMIIAVVLLVLPVAYVGSYLVLVDPIPPPLPIPAGLWRIPKDVYSAELINQDFGGESNYRWGGAHAAKFYWPLEQIDRKLRPGEWEGSEYNQSRPPGNLRNVELFNPAGPN